MPRERLTHDVARHPPGTDLSFRAEQRSLFFLVRSYERAALRSRGIPLRLLAEPSRACCPTLSSCGQPQRDASHKLLNIEEDHTRRRALEHATHSNAARSNMQSIRTHSNSPNVSRETIISSQQTPKNANPLRYVPRETLFFRPSSPKVRFT
jgi:hypothetical protein